jgi:hypothetical protein
MPELLATLGGDRADTGLPRTQGHIIAEKSGKDLSAVAT